MTTYHGRFPLTRRDIGRWGGFDPAVASVVQSVLLSAPNGQEILAENPALLVESIRRIFAKNPVPLKTAIGVASRELDPDTLSVVLAKERRSTVVEAVLTHNRLPIEIQRVLATKPSDGLARTLLSWDGLDSSLRPALAAKAGGRALLEEMAFAELSCYSDDEVLELFRSYDAVRPKASRGQLAFMLQTLFSRRPELVERVLTLKGVSERSRLLYAMASSDLSFEGVCAVANAVALDQEHDKFTIRQNRYAIRRLIENPRTPLFVADLLVERAKGTNAGFDAETARLIRGKADALSGDPAQAAPEAVQRFQQFTEPRSGWFSSPWVVFRLLLNPQLTGLSRTHLESRAARAFPSRFRELVEPELQRCGVTLEAIPVLNLNRARPDSTGADVFARLAEDLGTNRQAWEVFLSLVDEFEGGFEELLEIAREV
jgi:hypothetical protein